MNERIRELKKQAWEYAMSVHDGHIVPPLDKEVWPIDKVLDEKFAELIVRECIELNRQELAFNAFERMLNRYKEHFGVEE